NPEKIDPEDISPPVFIDGKSIWTCVGHQMVGLDGDTGAVKKVVPIEGELEGIHPAPSALLVMSATGPTRRIALHIYDATGEPKSQEVVVPRSEKHEMPNELPPNVQPTAAVLLRQETEEHTQFNKPIDAMSSQFFSAGDNMVELRV